MKKVVIIILLSLIGVLTIISTVIYNSKYFIKLKGDSIIDIKLGDSYKELGASTLINSKIKIVGKVDTNKVGTYLIKYYHKKVYRERIVNVIDDISPEITLNGLEKINILINGQYIEQGAKAIDNYDGDITDNISITSKLDLTKEGEYQIIYEVTDSSNNTSKITRTINVTNNEVLTKPINSFSLNGYFESTILKKTEDIGTSYLNDTIFFGDSITFNFFYYGQLPQKNIWAMSSLTPENAHTWSVPYYATGENITFIEGLKKYKPKYVIVTLGANAVAVTTREFFVSQYEDLMTKAKEASPNTVFIVSSVYPVDSRYVNTNLNNTKINNVNYYLAEMCERLGIYFLNVAESLKDSNGFLNSNYCYQNDGIHLLPSGNNVVMNYIRTHGGFYEKN